MAESISPLSSRICCEAARWSFLRRSAGATHWKLMSLGYTRRVIRAIEKHQVYRYTQACLFVGAVGLRHSETISSRRFLVNNATIDCPKCGAEIPITEALARPMLEAERTRIEQEVRERSAALETRERDLQGRQQTLASNRRELISKEAAIDKIVQEAMAAERLQIAASEGRRIEAHFQQKLDQANNEQRAQSAKIVELQRAEVDFRKQTLAMEEQKNRLELDIARQVDLERDRIREQAVLSEKKRFDTVLAEKESSILALAAQVEESQGKELAIRKEREALELDKRAAELQLQRRLDEERQAIREATLREEHERTQLSVAAKDKVIDDMRKKIDELQRKGQQADSWLTGEVQELALEFELRGEFPRDSIEAVGPGRAGADALQTVLGANTSACGTILWESKRTARWDNSWLAKVREDRRNANASFCVIVSAVLPKGTSGFDYIEDVWVCSFSLAIPLAKVLRQTIIQNSYFQQAGQDRNTKADRMYDYAIGQDLIQRISGIVDGYRGLCSEFDREKRATTAAWAKRQKFHDMLLNGASGLYGDVSGIAGNSLPKIEGLEYQPNLSVSHDDPVNRLLEEAKAAHG